MEVTALFSWLPNWYEQVIDEYEDMVNGPHKWFQVGEWGDYELDESSDRTALVLPNFALPKVDYDEITKIWNPLQVGADVNMWLVSSYLENSCPLSSSFRTTLARTLLNLWHLAFGAVTMKTVKRCPKLKTKELVGSGQKFQLLEVA